MSEKKSPLSEHVAASLDKENISKEQRQKHHIEKYYLQKAAKTFNERKAASKGAGEEKYKWPAFDEHYAKLRKAHHEGELNRIRTQGLAPHESRATVYHHELMSREFANPASQEGGSHLQKERDLFRLKVGAKPSSWESPEVKKAKSEVSVQKSIHRHAVKELHKLTPDQQYAKAKEDHAKVGKERVAKVAEKAKQQDIKKEHSGNTVLATFKAKVPVTAAQAKPPKPQKDMKTMSVTQLHAHQSKLAQSKTPTWKNPEHHAVVKEFRRRGITSIEHRQLAMKEEAAASTHNRKKTEKTFTTQEKISHLHGELKTWNQKKREALKQMTAAKVPSVSMQHHAPVHHTQMAQATHVAPKSTPRAPHHAAAYSQQRSLREKAQASLGGTQKGPRGGVFRLVNGRKAYLKLH